MGSRADRLAAALDLVEEWVREGIVPGVAVAVARHGEVVGERYVGKLAAGGGGPVGQDSLFPLGTLTIPYTAAAFLRLVERGLTTLDEPIRRLVPAVAAGPSSAEKRELTARDLLCHVAGLPPEVPDADALWARAASFAEWVEAAAAPPLEIEPGRRVMLSRVGAWLLGAAVETAAGVTFAEVLRADVWEPLGLTETFLMPQAAIQRRIARRYGRDRTLNTPAGRSLGSPAVGLFATARDVVRFAGAFLGDRARLQPLSSAALTLMTTAQTGDAPGGLAPPDGEDWTWSVASWGLGWEVKGGKTGHWSGDLTGPATFAHPGDAGTFVWVDPACGIACAVLANRDLSTGWNRRPARWARLANAVTAALTAEDPVAGVEPLR